MAPRPKGQSVSGKTMTDQKRPRRKPIPESRWKWFGNAGHFIMGESCRFHLCTLIGKHLVSTVGQLWHESEVREIMARSRGIVLEGRGDAREHDYMKKIGYDTIGCDRKFETMVFKVTGETCTDPACDCGMPKIDPTELDYGAYNEAGAATRGHMEICKRWATGEGAPRR